jgi:large conductance mechanosensitive channel
LKEERELNKKSKLSAIGKEFRDFAVRGNVIDLAVGVIIGGAFGKITSSLVSDVLMPFIGMFLAGFDFSNLAIKLPDLYNKQKVNYIKVGSFLSTVIDFVILAFFIFLMVKGINKLKEIQDKKTAAQVEAIKAEPELSTEVKLLTEIRDLLKEKSV